MHFQSQNVGPLPSCFLCRKSKRTSSVIAKHAIGMPQFQLAPQNIVHPKVSLFGAAIRQRLLPLLQTPRYDTYLYGLIVIRQMSPELPKTSACSLISGSTVAVATPALPEKSRFVPVKTTIDVERVISLAVLCGFLHNPCFILPAASRT